MSQKQQDSRGKAYLVSEACDGLGKTDCLAVGCSWKEDITDCSEYSPSVLCPNGCEVTVTDKVCTGTFDCPFGENTCQCGPNDCDKGTPGCKLEQKKACTGGKVPKPGSGSCTGTPANLPEDPDNGGNPNPSEPGDSGSTPPSEDEPETGDGGGSGGGNPSTPVSYVPKGYLDLVDEGCMSIKGWACDLDSPNQALTVVLYDGSETNQVGSATANSSREEGVASQCGGNSQHGYTIDLPASVRDGKQHNFIVKAFGVGNGGNATLTNSPKTIVCPQSGLSNGSFDNGTVGWSKSSAMADLWAVPCAEYGPCGHGSNYLRVARTQSGDGYVVSDWIQTSEDLSGKSFDVSFMVKAHDTTRNVIVQLQRYPNGSDWSNTLASTGLVEAVTGEWREITKVVTIPGSSSKTTMYRVILRPILGDNNSVISGLNWPVYYDNVRVTPR